MKFNRADVAVLKKLGVADLESCAHAYGMFRPLGDKLLGDKKLPEALLLIIAASAQGSETATPVEVPQAPVERKAAPALKMDLGDGVLRTVDEIASSKKKPKDTGSDGVWKKGRLLNYTRTRTIEDEETGKKETFTEVIPARLVKKTKTGRLVIAVEGKNITVAKDKVEDAENEPLRYENVESHGPQTFERQKASADVLRAPLNIT